MYYGLMVHILNIIEMDNGLLIALAIIFSLILLAINVYLLALYVHTDDKGFGTALYCKVLVVIGLTLCQAQALLVPLDVANNSAIDLGGIDMKNFWYFVYIVVLIFICLLLPFALFFYETDQDDGYCKRIGQGVLYTFLANIISIMMLFISWNFFKYVQLPVKNINTTTKFTTPQTTINFNTIASTEAGKTLELEASFAVYIVAIMSFFGWIFVVLFGGVGLFSLPIDMINAFRHRPKARKSDQMKRTKDGIVKAIASLVKEGEDLKKTGEENERNQGGWFSKWKGKRAFDNQMTEFKAKYHAIQQQYEVFNLQLKFADTNPIVPFLKLLLGIVFFITSILWVIQIIFGNIAKSFNRPLIPFLNEMLIGLNNRNAGFLSTGIFAYLCLYMLWCVQKGTVKFGIRIPCCCRFHPMKQNETWMNSFLFNVILMLIASVGVVQLCISSFPTYTANTEINMIFGLQVYYLKFYSAFYQNSIFLIALIVWTFLTLIYMMITCNKKPPYMKEIEKIRNPSASDD